MSEQLWAIVGKSGKFVLRYDEPIDGHKAETKDKNIWSLEREPDIANGEGIDYETGNFDFNLKRVLPTLISEVKEQAAKLIEAVSPDWKQSNDIRLPTPSGDARFEKIDGIRAWSNEIETRIAALDSVEAVIAIRAEVEAYLYTGTGAFMPLARKALL